MERMPRGESFVDRITIEDTDALRMVFDFAES